MWICPVCGNKNPSGSQYCSSCGGIACPAPSDAVDETLSRRFSRPAAGTAFRNPPQAAKRRNPWWIWLPAAVLALICLGLTLMLTVHDWQPATCTEPEICRICGRTRGEALGHDWGDWVTVTEPGTQTPGLRVRSCQNNPSHSETEELPPTGSESTTENGADPIITPSPSPTPTQSLSALAPLDSSDRGGFIYYDSGRDNLGNYYDNAYGGSIADTDNWVEFSLNGDYVRFSGTVYMNYQFRSETARRVKLTVYGDGKLLYTSPIITTGLPPQYFELDVSGVQTLRLVIFGNDYLRLSDCLLTRAD